MPLPLVYLQKVQSKVISGADFIVSVRSEAEWQSSVCVLRRWHLKKNSGHMQGEKGAMYERVEVWVERKRRCGLVSEVCPITIQLVAHTLPSPPTSSVSATKSRSCFCFSSSSFRSLQFVMHGWHDPSGHVCKSSVDGSQVCSVQRYLNRPDYLFYKERRRTEYFN